MSADNVLTLIGLIVSVIILVGGAIMGYILHQLNASITALSLRVDRHDEKIDALKEDAVDKRHALRTEIRDAFASQSEHMDRLEDKLRAEIKEKR